MATKREKLLDWAEKAGLESIKLHHQAADDLGKEATTTLTVLLAGAGGALAYSAKAIDGGGASPLAVSSGAACVWLFVLCAILVQKCLKVRDIAAQINEPLNLFQPEYDLDALREVELKNLQERINQVRERNEKTAYWLNGVRLAAIATPAVGAIAWWLASYLPSSS